MGKQAERNAKALAESYLVWPYDASTKEPAMDAREYFALDVECAAELHAEYFYRHEGGRDHQWPCDFYVKTHPAGKLYRVTVGFAPVPEFDAHEPQEIT